MINLFSPSFAVDGKLSASKLKQRAVKACRELELQKMHKLLNQYLLIIAQVGLLFLPILFNHPCYAAECVTLAVFCIFHFLTFRAYEFPIAIFFLMSCLEVQLIHFQTPFQRLFLTILENLIIMYLFRFYLIIINSLLLIKHIN